MMYRDFDGWLAIAVAMFLCGVVIGWAIELFLR